MLKSPWELILTEPVPEVVEFRSADWAEKYFSAQSARSSSRVTLSPSYTKQFSSSIDLVAWPVRRGGCRGEFQKRIFNEAEEIAREPILFHQFSRGIYRKYIVNFYRRCRGHATISTERGNDRLITVQAPFLVLAIVPNLNGPQQLT